MCNCNQKRLQIKTSIGNKASSSQGMGQVRLKREKPLTLFGDVTGREYSFHEKGAIQWVDRVDMQFMKGLPGIEVLG